MSDPYRNPPGTNPPRYPEEPRGNAGWIAAAVIALVIVIGGIAMYRADQTPSASNPPIDTTGQGSRAPAPIIPPAAKDQTPAPVPAPQR